MSCRDAGSETDNSSVCDYFRDHEPDCACERKSVSPYSPSPVEDGEPLLRLIFSPIHINDETGEVMPAAFSDVSDKGLSINRRNHASLEQIDEYGHAKARSDKANGKSRQYLGSVQALCGDIRALSEDEARLFCVYDTAVEENTAHGDVCQARLEGKAKDKRTRKLLREQFTKIPALGKARP